MVGVRGWRCTRCDAAARPGPERRTRCSRLQPEPGLCSLERRPSGERRPRRHPALSPGSRAPRRTALQGRRGGERPRGATLGARGRGRAPPGGRLGGRGRGRAPDRVGGRGRGTAAPRAAPGARAPRQGPGGAMAAGSITTLPALPEDGGSGAFPPGHFKDPKRLYCKNGGFFLRIHPDGRVDGVREKSDPHSECWPALLPRSHLHSCGSLPLRSIPSSALLPSLHPDLSGTCGFFPSGPRWFRVHHSPLPPQLRCRVRSFPRLWSVPVSPGKPVPWALSLQGLGGGLPSRRQPVT